MKWIGAILSVLLFAFLIEFILPWWSVIIVSALIAFFWNMSYAKSFAAGFFGLAILWGGMAFYFDFYNQSILTGQIGALFGNLTPAIIICLTAFLGGIIGGMGMLVGIAARKIG